MAGVNTKIVKKAFADFSRTIEKTTYDWLCDWCELLLREAVEFRKNPARIGGNGEVSSGHNFTGNLINSICVILYQSSKKQKTSFFASRDVPGLKPAIRRELSGLNSRGKQRKNRIFFRPGSRFGDRDWSDQWSSLKAETLIGTDESWGQTDALKFANSWIPTIKADFVICVAYTSEYADWVEMRNGTTGIVEMEAFAARTGVELIGLKRA